MLSPTPVSAAGAGQRIVANGGTIAEFTNLERIVEPYEVRSWYKMSETGEGESDPRTRRGLRRLWEGCGLMEYMLPYDTDVSSEEYRWGQEIGIAIVLLAAAVGGMIRSVMIYATEVLGDAPDFRLLTRWL